jgi:protein phosphatase 2C family protein 2/3
LLALAGIWDVLSSQQVIDYVRLSLSHRQSLPTICETLMDRCLAPDSDWGGVGCDNMTVLIVAILGKRTKDEWYDWMASRVDAGDNGVGYKTPKEIADPFAQGPRGALSGPVGRVPDSRNEEDSEEEESGATKDDSAAM